MAGNTSMNPTHRATLPDAMDFERLLRREMTVAPSAEFLARVRTRIDTEQMSRSWPWRWLVPVSAIAAACAVFAVLTLSGTGAITLPAAPGGPSLATAQPIQMLEAPVTRSSPLPVRAVASGRVSDRGAIVSRADEPVVIVDERQRAALAAFIHVIRDGRITHESFAQTLPVSLDPIRDRVLPVEARPLTVSTIFVDGVLQEEHR
jgi:hypothetical protein